MKCKSLNGKLEKKYLQLFFGCFDFDVKMFRFYSGERQQIRQIKLFVQTARSTEEQSYFEIENECDLSTVNTIRLTIGLFFRNTTKAVNVYEQKEHTELTPAEKSENSESTSKAIHVNNQTEHTEIAPAETFEFPELSMAVKTDNNEPIMAVNSGLGKDEIARENLFIKCVTLLNPLMKTPQELMTSDMVEVERTGNSIWGKIICVFCKNKKSKSRNKHIKIQAVSSKRSAIYWNLSNFKKHLKRTHKMEVDNNSEDMSVCGSADDSLSVSNDDSNRCLSAEQSNNSDCNGKDSLRDEIFNQISAQILEKGGDVLLHSEVTEQIMFRINDIEVNVNIAKIKGDGHCMYAALCHQLHSLEISSENHDLFTENLRLEVINYLRNHLTEFRITLKGRLLEEWDESCADELKRSKDLTAEDWMEHINNLLNFQMPKQSFWGGVETLKAVADIYKVNIAIINEGGDIYFVTGFNSKFNRTLVLAYRYSKFSKKRNHYDSVSEIGNQIIFSAAEYLSQIQLNGQNESNKLSEESTIQLD